MAVLGLQICIPRGKKYNLTKPNKLKKKGQNGHP